MEFDYPGHPPNVNWQLDGSNHHGGIADKTHKRCYGGFEPAVGQAHLFKVFLEDQVYRAPSVNQYSTYFKVYDPKLYH